MDLVIRGSTVVTARTHEVADVGVADGRIAQIGGTMAGRREVEAAGLFLLPGGVDPHVHLTNELPLRANEPGWVDDFSSGSEAAFAGGVTSLGNMTMAAHGVTMSHAEEVAHDLVATQASADVFLHPVLSPFYPGATEEVPRLAAKGHRSLKLFMSNPDFDHQIDEYRRAIKTAAEVGTMVLLHCEDAGVVHHCTAALTARGCGLQHFAESRPPIAEVTAVRRAIALGEETGAHIYVVHLSCAEALASCEQARARGVRVYVEARPLYLYLTSDCYRSDDAALYVGQPPLRERTDIEALWAGIRKGSIDTLGSDHAPWTAEQKRDPKHTLENLRPGVAELETMLPLLLSRTFTQRDMPLERIVALTATNPARLFGLYPRKGTIAVGSDADLVLWDFRLSRVIEGSKLRSRARYSPYEGMSASAWPRITFRRGEMVFAENEILAKAGTGQLLARGPTLPPA